MVASSSDMPLFSFYHFLQDKEVAVVVSFLEIYCDRVRDLGEAYMSHGEREVDGLKTTSDIYRRIKSVRCSVAPGVFPCSPPGFH